MKKDAVGKALAKLRKAELEYELAIVRSHFECPEPHGGWPLTFSVYRGPDLISEVEWIEALKDAGFDVIADLHGRLIVPNKKRKKGGKT